MDLRKLKTLVDLVSESNISELEITEADGKVRIVKSERAVGQMGGMAQPLVAPPMMNSPVATASMPAPQAASPAARWASSRWWCTRRPTATPST